MVRLTIPSFIFSLLLFISLKGQGLEALAPFHVPEQYNCLLISTPPIIDGNMEDSIWRRATWSDDFVDIAAGAIPYRQTRVKMLWDKEFLYIAAYLEEPHLWATLKERDAIIYYDNDFEVFIDPDGDTHNYLEIEVNALNTIFDLMLVKPYRNGGPMIIAWDLATLQSAVKLNGTLNNPRDKDSCWTVEMAIPMRHLIFDQKRNFPKIGDRWYINFSRVHWELEIKDSLYQKKIDPRTGKGLPENNWVWSPQGLINMHCPEKWGYLNFADSLGRNINTDLEVEELKWILRQLYERQWAFHKKNKTFSAQLTDLGLKELKFKEKKLAYRIDKTATDFQISIDYKNTTWHIRSDSKTWKTKP